MPAGWRWSPSLCPLLARADHPPVTVTVTAAIGQDACLPCGTCAGPPSAAPTSTHQHPPTLGWHRPRPEPGWQPPVRPHSRFRGSGDRGQRRVPAAEGHQRSPSRELFPLRGPAAPLLPGAAARGGRGPQGRGAGRVQGASCPHGRLHRGGHRGADVCPWPGPLLGAQRGCWGDNMKTPNHLSWSWDENSPVSLRPSKRCHRGRNQ
ncbi:uncharacterized protein LOC128807762 [Vidua macroura]|uniref:uncharacterized protein LOC128807762 n=1 Tax=Vidua macroura TaxID=187451 RepID=UPI0023A8057E|nr:uncharacterized protein LOC128807762 [Vidua macroura]